MSSAPHVEIDGNREVIIGQHRTIVLYSAEEMQIDCGGLLLRILGSGLELRVLTAEELSICGTVAAVEYLTNGGRKDGDEVDPPDGRRGNNPRARRRA